MSEPMPDERLSEIRTRDSEWLPPENDAQVYALLAEVDWLRTIEQRVWAVIAESQRIGLTVSRNDELLAALDGAEHIETPEESMPTSAPPVLRILPNGDLVIGL